MKKRLFSALLGVLLTAGISAGQEPSKCLLNDAASGKALTITQAVARLKGERVIVIGEHHTDAAHHACQLEIIAALHGAGVPVAIGMEMFRKESQPSLDQWTSGRMDKDAFVRVYYENWNYPWPLYAGILQFAREKEIPVVGLNVPPDITRQVARRGFDSLSAAQKEQLSGVACRVDSEYMEYIARVHGAHAHGRMEFAHFCEAQMVWDNAMAIHALEYLKAHTGKTLVILAGGAHAQKMGIPRQIAERSELSPTVILPGNEVQPGKGPFGGENADFIFTVENAP